MQDPQRQWASPLQSAWRRQRMDEELERERQLRELPLGQQMAAILQRMAQQPGRVQRQQQQAQQQAQQQRVAVLPLSSDGPPFSSTRISTVQTEVSTTGRLAQLEEMMQPAAKMAIQAALFQYQSCSLPSTTNPALPSSHLERALQIMEQYKSSERMVQLELAVWKALCVVEMPDCGYYQTQEWMTSGWKTRKAEQRNSNAASIILGAVKEFLD